VRRGKKKKDNPSNFDRKLEALRQYPFEPSSEFKQRLESTLLNEIEKGRSRTSLSGVKRFFTSINSRGIIQRIVAIMGVTVVGTGGALAFNEDVRHAVEDAFIPKGSLVIRSEEYPVDVFLDGELGGETPVEITRLETGEKTLKITREGFKPLVSAIEIEHRKTTIVDIDFNENGEVVFKEKGKEYKFILEPEDQKSVVWDEYKNQKFNFKLEYPSEFICKPMQNNEGAKFEADGRSIYFVVFAEQNTEEKTIGELFSQEFAQDSVDISFEDLGDNSCTVSGVDADKDIFYTRKTIIEDTIYILNFQYDRSEEGFFNSLLSQIVGSFEVFSTADTEEINEWETYTHSSGKLSFLYPEVWNLDESLSDEQGGTGELVMKSPREKYTIGVIYGKYGRGGYCFGDAVESLTRSIKVDGFDAVFKVKDGISKEIEMCKNNTDERIMEVDILDADQEYRIYMTFKIENQNIAKAIFDEFVESIEINPGQVSYSLKQN
jgi:hypothetical protein